MTVRQPDFPVTVAGQLLAFTEFLEKVGASWRAGLRRARLPSEIVDPTGWLPAVGVTRFVGDMSRREDLPDLGVRVGQMDRPDIAHPALARAIRRGPTLSAALVSVCELSRLQGSHWRLWLQGSPETLWVCHLGSLPANEPGTEQGEYLRVARLVRAIRGYLGQAWAPEWIDLVTQSSPPPLLVEELDDCRTRTGMPFGAIAIPRKLVARSSPDSERAADREPVSESNRVDAAQGDLVARIESILPNYLAYGRLTVEVLSEIVGARPRSLQRLLAEHGSSHTQLIERARFDRATRLLQNTDLPATEIANLVGYTDPSNFARAFRRLSGRSPAQYRLDHNPTP